MTSSTDDGPGDRAENAQDPEQSKDRETPEVGLIADEDLPEDLQPTDDNPLAQDPDQDDGDEAGEGADEKAAGMPDIGNPGSPA